MSNLTLDWDKELEQFVLFTNDRELANVLQLNSESYSDLPVFKHEFSWSSTVLCSYIDKRQWPNCAHWYK